MCSGINEIDHSALEALEQLAYNLREARIHLHLAEVKGPVMDRLGRSDFFGKLAPGRVFLTAEMAVEALSGGD